MTNHVHLLMTPDNSDGISRVMQSLGRRYVQQINFRYRRSGTLWDGRHKSSLIDSETYFLTCMRYIELNPVRANMVERPENYRWSSYLANATTKPDPIVNRHSLYMALGEDDACRRDAYQRLFDEEIRQTDLSFIRQSIQSSSPLGSERFMHEIEKTVGRSTGFSKRGRPGQR
jgi:putative transposase